MVCVGWCGVIYLCVWDINGVFGVLLFVYMLCVCLFGVI